MITYLDLLVLVFMGICAVTLLALVLMYLLKKPLVKRICLWFLAAEGLVMGVLNYLMKSAFFPEELAVGWFLAAVALAAVLVDWLWKSPKAPKAARIMVTASVVLGIINAFMV